MRRFLLTGFLFIALSAPLLYSQAPNPPPPNPDAEEWFQKASQAFGENEYEVALSHLARFDQLAPEHPAGQNLRGAILVRQRKLPEAEAVFRAMLEKRPDDKTAMFNLGEALFVQRRFAEARPLFEKFNEGQNNALATYKFLLCDLLGGREAEARRQINNLLASAYHPLYYFAHAAVKFHEDKGDEARKLLQSAFSIYPGGTNATFADSLIELGWITADEISVQGEMTSPSMEMLTETPEREGSVRPSLDDMLPEFETR